MADVVAEADRFGQRFVQAEVAGDGAANLGHLEGVGQAGDVVVALGIDEHLGLVLEAAERLGVHDAIPVPLESRTPEIGPLRHGASP